jgi:hypothetical protein
MDEGMSKKSKYFQLNSIPSPGFKYNIMGDHPDIVSWGVWLSLSLIPSLFSRDARSFDWPLLDHKKTNGLSLGISISLKYMNNLAQTMRPDTNRRSAWKIKTVSIPFRREPGKVIDLVSRV